MGLRVLLYMAEIWKEQIRVWEDSRTPPSERNLYPILPIVLYTGKRRWKTPISLAAIMQIPPDMEVFVPKWETLLLNLKETPSEKLTNSETPVAQALLALQAMDAPVEELARVLREVASSLDLLPDSEQAARKRAMLYLYLLVQHTRQADEQEFLIEEVDRVVARHRADWEETSMTGAQVLVREAQKEARREGREEGREEGIEHVVLRLLRCKFGNISEQMEARVRSLSQLRLLEIAERLLQASTLEELGL